MNELAELLRAYEGTELVAPRRSPDGVNPAMIRHWCRALGDDNPRYAPGPQQVAPPAMLQAWCMQEMEEPAVTGPAAEIDALLERHGYTAVVATDCEQEYARDLLPGDLPTQRRVLESVSDEKRTALGPGFFLTVAMTYDVAGEQVATMRFRTLRYRPQPGPDSAHAGPDTAHAGPDSAHAGATEGQRPRPALNEDNRFFFDGAARGELLVRRCTTCGRDQHPPMPMCPACGGLSWQERRMSGEGTVYSYTITHHPQFPGFAAPFVVALVELAEGPRIVTNLIGIDPDDVRIGLPVEASFTAVDDELTLPLFRPRSEPPSAASAGATALTGSRP